MEKKSNGITRKMRTFFQLVSRTEENCESKLSFYCPLHHVMISDKRVVEVVQSSIFCFGSKQVHDPFFVCFVKLATIYRISKNSVVLLLQL